LRITPRAVRNLIRNGDLHAVNVRGQHKPRLRIPAREIDELVGIQQAALSVAPVRRIDPGDEAA
jgi:hypothetical protein